jgi:NAD+ kinase
MLRAEVTSLGMEQGDTGDRIHLALNDVVVGRGQSLRTVTVDLEMDGQPLHSFRCDGVIVATATGSTAYSFAAGGPILAPWSSDLAVTAICPHISSLKSLVVPGDVPLRMQVWTEEPAGVTVDGQIDAVLGNGAIVDTRKSECDTTFARRGTPAEFYSRILSKLH